jgi:regulatory protein
MVVIKLGRRSGGRIPEADADRLNIREGAEWTEDLRAAVTASIARAKGRQYALNALGRRPMSRRTLLFKLRQRGLDEVSAAAIADELAAKGILNEASFAEGVVHAELTRKPAGKHLLMARLRQRGVEDAAARKAVTRAVEDPSYDARAGALDLARRKRRTMSPRLEPEAVRRRLYAALARRGFDPDVCRWAIDRVERPGDDDAASD